VQLIDSHVHINFDSFEPDLDLVAQRWRDQGIVGLVHSCVEPGEFPAIQRLAHRFPELYFAVGMHPLDVALWHQGSKESILELAASDPKVVAIGETGLDFYKANNSDDQIQVFRDHLAIARQLNLPVIIHCRDAADKMAEIIKDEWESNGSVSGVMHCWGGSPLETSCFLDLGFYVSFSGTVTFKNARQIHESAKIVPNDRLLVETDCPFLSPVPKRGERRNEPANVFYVAQRVAELREESLEDLAAMTTQNACQLFGLPTP
jgi:TatD DNase family protein